jgi:hypothetical protein
MIVDWPSFTLTESSPSARTTMPHTYPTPPPLPSRSAPQKVRAYLAANPDSASTLERLLAHDKTSHPNPKDRHTTGGLMWLLRGLKFTSMGLRINLDNPTEELSTSFTKGYEGSLKKWHGFAVRPIFYVSEARRGNELVHGPRADGLCSSYLGVLNGTLSVLLNTVCLAAAHLILPHHYWCRRICAFFRPYFL